MTRAPQPQPTALRPVRVVVADDQHLVRAGFRLLLDSEEDMEVVGEAADGVAAVELATALEPDVVLMDIRMPGIDGLEATRRISAAAPDHVRVLVVTTYEVDEYVVEAIRSGASGFVLKDIPPADLLTAVRVVHAGDALLSPAVTRRLLARFAGQPGSPGIDHAALAVLTDREREVMALVGQGLSNDEIAAALAISPATARTHVSRAMTKVDARDRAQLVVLAYRTGLVAVDR